MKRLLELDDRLSTSSRLVEKPGPLRTLTALLAHSGDSWFWLLGLLIVWWLGDPLWKERALVLGRGLIITAILVLIIKFTVRRRRPAGDWGRIYRKTDPHSFPSGHAARAVMLAVLAARLGPPWFGGLLLLWAPLVALARVSMGVHYLSDVLAGLLFGLLLGLVLPL